MTYDERDRGEPRGRWVALWRAVGALCVGFFGGISFLWVRIFADLRWQILLLLSLASFLIAWSMVVSEVRRLTQQPAQEEIPSSTALGPLATLAIGSFLLGTATFVVFLSIHYGSWGE